MQSDRPATILVADDNPATLYSTARILRGAGWEVVEATNGNEALQRALAGVDLVILDVNMPDIDGFEVCRRLRSSESTAHLPVVHLSATFVRDTDKIQGLQSGADGYLTHPVEPPVLVASVNAFLRTRRAEAARRDSEVKYKAIFDSALHGIALLSESGRILEANPALCQMLQQSSDEIIGANVYALVPGKRPELSQEIVRALTQTNSWQSTIAIARQDGSSVQTEWTISKHSLPMLHLALVTDITARTQLEADRDQLLNSERAARGDAERANRLKDDFLATLSHELRTPLNSIVGWSQLLRRAPADPQTLREGLETIERNARAQAQLIADLLDVSSIASGKLRLNVELVDLPSVIEEALAAIMLSANSKSIRITKAIDAHTKRVRGDSARLQQIVWNLLSNAVKFTPDNGNIEIRLQEEDSKIELSVIDDGKGIDAQLLPVIFERFRQGDSSSTRNQGGLGLGLAIVKNLVELHGGTVRADSSGAGKGAKITVRLPPAPAGSAIVGSETWTLSVDPQVRLDGTRVLLVDDDPDACALVQRVLENVGAEALACTSVDAALASLTSFLPDVILSDIGMPSQDGYDLIREVRNRGFGHRQVPAIALTAFARTDDRRRALLAGYQLHITKPVDPAELIASIASLSGRT